MRPKFIYLSLFLIFSMYANFFPLVLSNEAIAQDQSSGDQYPIIYMPVLSYEFDPVLEGTEVFHEFTVINKGTAVLEIKDIRTG